MDDEQNYWERTVQRKVSRRRVLAGTGGTLAALAAAVTVGCGDDDGDSGNNGQPTSPAGASPTSAAQAQQGGTLTLTTFSGDPPSLDPVRHLSFLSQYIGGLSYSRLLSYKTGPGVEPLGEIQGDLAENFEIVGDGLKYTFKLRPGVKFHNRAPLNGRELTANDVVASFKRFREQPSPNAGSLAVVDKVEASDARTVTFTLKQPFSPFVELLASPSGLWIFSEEASTGSLDPTQQAGVIGTGPFIFDSYRPSVELNFKRNPDYYLSEGGQKLPHVDALQFLIISEYSQLLSQFVAGRTHVFAPRNADIQSVRSDAKKVKETKTRPGWLGAYHSFNKESNKGLFKDPRARQAWSMSLDRAGLIEAFGEVSKLKGSGIEIESGWSNTAIPWGDGGLFWWLDPQGNDFGPGAEMYKFDVGRAKKLLSESGYDGSPIDFNFVTGRYGTTYDQFTEAQIPMARAAGFNLNPKSWEYSRMIGSEEGKTFPGVFYNYQTPFTTADEYVFNSFHPDVGARGAPLRQFTSPELVSLVEKQRREFDRQARRDIIHDIQRKSSELITSAPSVFGRWGGVAMTQSNVNNYFEHDASGSYGFGAEQLPFVWLNS